MKRFFTLFIALSVLIIIFASVLAGCSGKNKSTYSGSNDNPSSYSSSSERSGSGQSSGSSSSGSSSSSSGSNYNYTKKEEPRVGMTKDELLASTWGAPLEKSITEAADGTYENWYYNSSYSKYIIIKNGKVISISHGW